MTKLTMNKDEFIEDEAAQQVHEEQVPESVFIVRPLGDRVIVRRLQEEAKTKGGIYIPEQAKEKPLEGVVLAVGDGRYLEGGYHLTIPLEVGDRVLFSRYSGSEIKIGEESLLILNVSDIQGVYNWDPVRDEVNAYFSEPGGTAPEIKDTGAQYSIAVQDPSAAAKKDAPSLLRADGTVELPKGIGMSGTKPAE